MNHYAILKVDDQEFIIPKSEEKESNPRTFLYKEQLFDNVYDEHCA